MFKRILLLTIVALVAGCGGSESDEEQAATTTMQLPTGSEAVQLDPADFSADVDHPYWPMAQGNQWVYEEDGKRVEVTVTDRTRTIAGIEARVVHDVVSEGGQVVEDTFDWYARDREGNVWYLGEDTTEFEDGKPVSKKGSWEHGVDGAQAGILLPADPEPGLAYRQEYYEGKAEDRAKVLSLAESIAVPYGAFRTALTTEETTPLEPDVVERKYYVRDVGPVAAVAVSGGGGTEKLVSFETRAQ
jgi:hypothetical protein